MKKTLLMLITTLIMMKSSSAQEFPHHDIPNTSREKDKAMKFKINSPDYYLNKSAKLQNTSWKLASVGGFLGISGFFLYTAKDNLQNQMGAASFDAGLGGLLMISGILLVSASIPLYLESIHYKKKALAMTASLNLESIRDLYQPDMLAKYYPALSLHVHL